MCSLGSKPRAVLICSQNLEHLFLQFWPLQGFPHTLQFPFQSILVHWFLECQHPLLPSPVWPLPICRDLWTKYSRFLCNVLFTSLDFTSITSHIHNCVLFLLWLHLFIPSGVISPLISSSILDTYRPGEFLFQYPIILPFHTVHRVLKARILKGLAISFSSGPRF